MDGLNDQSLLDVRKLISGKDGRLFVTTKAGINIFLAEVDTFQAQISPANTDYQPVGSSLIYSVNTGYSVTLTLTEAVVRDGQSERVVYRNCVPDGTIDLQTLNPGEIIKRAWSFRVNATPEMLEQFKEAEWKTVE